jgi:hypothetical protein
MTYNTNEGKSARIIKSNSQSFTLLPPEEVVPTFIGQKDGNELPPNSYTGNERGACNPRAVSEPPL